MSEVIFEGTLGVVGGGNMAKSILTPLIEKGTLNLMITHFPF